MTNRFGRLTPTDLSYREPRNGIMVVCQCDCGIIRKFRRSDLIAGRAKSCGCARREGIAERNFRHGGFYTAEYDVWCGIKTRCSSASVTVVARQNYFERGIRVCERWQKSFASFLADMGPRPSDKHSIDRINNDGDYEPSNCRWATRKEQNNNTRATVYVDYRGERMSLLAAKQRAGCDLPSSIVTDRLRNGWNVEDALNTPRLTNTTRHTLHKTAAVGGEPGASAGKSE